MWPLSDGGGARVLLTLLVRFEILREAVAFWITPFEAALLMEEMVFFNSELMASLSWASRVVSRVLILVFIEDLIALL